MTNFGFDTLAIHGLNREQPPGPTSPVICQTSTFTLPIDPDLGPQMEGSHLYTRVSNPNFTEVEEVIAALEGGGQACLFASGMAAAAGVIQALSPRYRRVAVSDDLYGTMRTMFGKMVEQRLLDAVEFMDLTDPYICGRLSNFGATLVWAESITNPMLHVPDLRRLGEWCRTHHAVLAVDNTFTSPVFCRPLQLGADVVVHSATKYLGGHSNVVAGVTITQSPGLAAAINDQRRIIGGIQDPFGAWLLRQGLNTLPLRMRQHAANALAFAEALEGHPKIRLVLHPGLPSHPQHRLAQSQFTGHGGMVTLELDTDLAGTSRVLQALKVFRLAVSLGGVESLVNHPANLTHGCLDEETKRRLGITPGVLRLSLGLEDVADLIEDFRHALGAI
jgi:cystathionine gamma-lyase